MDLRPDSPDTLLRKLGVTPDKAYGQNFILEPAVIDEILRFARPSASDRIVEIGPGLGALTRELLSVGEVTAIEIEEAFCRYLTATYQNLDVINEDIRAFDLAQLGEDLLVFGNIPYSFSSEILFHLLDHCHQDSKRIVKRAVLLVQKEFAERVASQPGPKSYGVPSIRTAIVANVRLGPIFPGNIFYPTASVESQVLELRFLEEPRYAIDDMLHFRHVLAIAFGSRRRKIFNSLLSSNQFDGELLRASLAALDISPESRVESITPEQFVLLSNRLFHGAGE